MKFETLRSPALRLQSCLSRQQGLASKVAKLQSAQEACQGGLLQATELLSAAPNSLTEAEAETQKLFAADFPPPRPLDLDS